VHRVADITIHKVGQVPETRLRSVALCSPPVGYGLGP
jgi:hypothetical protein